MAKTLNDRILYCVTKINKDFDTGRLNKQRAERLEKYKQAIYRRAGEASE